MSLFTDPETHAANPPESWTVAHNGYRWELRTAGGDPLETFRTKAAAEEGRTAGFLAEMYAKETRWYAGEPVTGWRPYAEVAPGKPTPANA